jgi:hypothetical protein
VKFGAVVPVLNEWTYLPVVLGQLFKVCDRVIVLRGTKSLSGASVRLTMVPDLDLRTEIVEGAWASEHETRNAGLDILEAGGMDYVFTVDSDEILSDAALAVLTETCETQKPRALLGGCHTYWKTPEWRIDPPEKLVAPLVVRKDVRFERLRMFSGESTVINRYVFHHLSYVRTDEEVQEKLRLFGHASEVVPGWYDRVWKAWDANNALENLHPTHPEAFKRAVKVTDDGLKKILAEYGARP